MGTPVAVSIVGCGVIARQYAERLRDCSEVRLVGAFDADVERAKAFAEQYELRAFGSLDELLADAETEVVLDLTPGSAHAAVNRAAIEAGKHVYSEKPLAMTVDDATALVAHAERAGVRLAAAPITYMGEAQQTAWKLLRDGACGRVHTVYADLNFGPLETWHPAPQPFYEVGPLVDIGVYPIALITAFLGPAVRARGIARTLQPVRRTTTGQPFEVRTPDWVLGIVELASGAVIRLTVTFATQHSTQRGIEFQGDAGALFLESHQFPNCAVRLATIDAESFTDVPLVRAAPDGIDWSRGVADLATAIRTGRPHRASAAHAAHTVEVVCAIAASAARDGEPIEVRSTFPAPEPEAWAR